MNRYKVFNFLVWGSLFLLGCAGERQETAVPEPPPVVTVEPVEMEAPPPSCGRPDAALQAVCDQEAAHILSATVRLHVRRYEQDFDGGRGRYLDGGVGHGTVKEGRYVVTHNHFKVSLTDESLSDVVLITVKDWQGETVLKEMPLAAVTVQAVEAETVVLDFGLYGDTGLFDLVDFPSAEFATPATLDVHAGMEVAQVDWDGDRAHVDWVVVEDVLVEDGVPLLQLANPLMEGASGGGVFWHGVHVANNWASVSAYNGQTGELMESYSLSALNINLADIQVGS